MQLQASSIAVDLEQQRLQSIQDEVPSILRILPRAPLVAR